MDRLSFFAANAMSLALPLVIAYQRTYYGQRIVLEQDLRRFHHPVLLEKTDHFRDIGLDRTALHTAERLLALQAAICFIKYMYRHNEPP